VNQVRPLFPCASTPGERAGLEYCPSICTRISQNTEGRWSITGLFFVTSMTDQA
jgi:hypothetical protein